MQIKTDGLVIREINIGESDRIVTILTREKGVLRASARGSRNIKNKLGSATQLFAYANLTLFRGREKYIIDDAEPLDLFMGLRKDLQRLALAQYFAELAGSLAPREEDAEVYLRLILNAFHLLEGGKRPPALIKAAYEMRMLTFSGYMPNLVACAGCGRYEADDMYLLAGEGTIVCGECIKKGHPAKPCCLLSRGALAALRHTVYADFERLFSFSLSENALGELAYAGEQYLLCCVERSFPTLEFYRGLLPKAAES